MIDYEMGLDKYCDGRYTDDEIYLIESIIYFDETLGLNYYLEYINNDDCFYKYYEIGNTGIQDILLDYVMSNKLALIKLLSRLDTQYIKYNKDINSFTISSSISRTSIQRCELVYEAEGIHRYNLKPEERLINVDKELQIARKLKRNGRST